jgi:hypothetical protein
MMPSVEHVEFPNVGHFRRGYVKPRKPVVLAGASDHWRARRWTIAGLVERLGEREVTPVVLRGGHVHVDLDRGLVRDTMPFRTFVDQLERECPPRYSLPLELTGPYADLRQDLTVPPYCVGSIYTKVNLWVAGTGTVTDAHYDMLHNLLAQLQGKRRVTLFAPADTPCLYPYPMRTLHWHHSQVRLEAPDPTQFPRFGNARALQVELAAGDVLFIPRGWWHHIEAVEPSLAVNFFWLTPRWVPAIAAARVLWTLANIRSS